MDSFDDFKKQLNQPADQLPEGFGWDDMQEGIYEKMPQKRTRRRGLLFFLTCVGLTLGLGTFYTYLSATTETKKEETPLEKTEQSLPKQDTKSINYATLENALQTTANSKPIVGEAQPNVNQGQSEATTSSTTEQSILSPGFTSTEHSSGIPTLTRNSFTIPTSAALEIKNENIDIITTHSVLAEKDQNITLDGSVQEQEITTLKALQLKTIALLKTSSPFLALASNTIAEFEHQEQSQENQANSPTSFNRIAVNLVGNGFSSTPATSSTAITPWWGSGIGIGYEHGFTSKLSLSASARVQRLKEEFSFTDRDTIAGTGTVDQDVHVFDHNDLLLRTTSRAQQQQYDRQRRELAYNYLDILDLSLGARYHFSPEKQSLYTGIDLGASIRLSASGQQLDAAGEIVAIDEQATFSNRVAGLVSPYCGYSFKLPASMQLSLETGLQYRYAFGIPTTKRFSPLNAYASVGLSIGLQ